MSEQIRGVNLGGWLVLERWIMPSLFEGTKVTDEYTLCRELGTEATNRITHHRETFITEADIKKIADLGLNTVRVPVGYWLFGGEDPFVEGADEYLAWLFTWAETYHLKVILDIHAVPGSQNGWDHSGKAGELKWSEPDNVSKTLVFLEQICRHYSDKTSLWGIGVLNEPRWDVSVAALSDYYHRAYDLIRSYSENRIAVILSDSFRSKELSGVVRDMNLSGTVLETHLYQLFSEEDRALDFAGHMKKAKKQWAKELKQITKQLPVIVGEWSSVMSELYNPVEQHKQNYTDEEYVSYAQQQIAVFEKAGVAGWIYWTARTEHPSHWSLLDHPELLGK